MKTFKKIGLKPFDVSLTSILAASNFAISLYLAPVLTAIIPKVFVGVLLMAPLDLFIAYIVWAITRKSIYTLYFFVYGLLTMPTTIWGDTPGIFKPFLGIAIGLSLDLLTLRLEPQRRTAIYAVAVAFPLIWWFWTASVWTLAGLPIVQIFRAMVMSIEALKSIASQGFTATFTIIALMTMPSSVVATHAAVSLSKRIEHIITIPQGKTVKEEIDHG